MKDALLIVDLQYDFMPGGALGVKKGDEIIPIVNVLIGKFDYTVASFDWHPKRHVSFAKTHGKKVGESIEIHGVIQKLWPIHCVQNTHGAELVKELKKDFIDCFFPKGEDPNIDSYSAFFDNNKERETGLDPFLRERGITRLYIAGLTTDFCVKYSAIDALAIGYEVFVISDACRPVFEEIQSFEEIRKNGGKILQSRDLLIK